MFFLGVFSMFINLEKHEWPVVSLSVSSLSSLIVYRFVLNNMSPISSHFLISDKLYAFLLVIAFFVLMLNLFFIVIEKNKHEFFEHAKLIRSYVLFVVLLVVPVFLYALIF